jgi:hypothetical protein
VELAEEGGFEAEKERTGQLQRDECPRDNYGVARSSGFNLGISNLKAIPYSEGALGARGRARASFFSCFQKKTLPDVELESIEG